MMLNNNAGDYTSVTESQLGQRAPVVTLAGLWFRRDSCRNFGTGIAV